MSKYKPTATGNKFTLSCYTFQVFTIRNFDFDEDIEISQSKGVYCFSKTLTKTPEGKETKKFKTTHSLLYLGKSDGEGGINGRLVHSHEKFHMLKEKGACFLSIYECSDKENAKEIESEILSKYNFQCNDAENEDCVDKKISVEED